MKLARVWPPAATGTLSRIFAARIDRLRSPSAQGYLYSHQQATAIAAAMEEVDRLVKAKDHHGVLTHIRANKLRQPQHVVAAGTALLGPEARRSGGLGLSERLAVLEQMVMASIDVGDMELAERCLAEIKKSAPEDSARYRRLLGLCLEAAGDLSGAEQEYDDLLAENPSNKFALKRKYCILRAQPGKEVQAREAFNTLLESAGGDPASWAEFGRVAQEAGDYKAAIYAWEEVVLACPLSADVHCTLGELYTTLGGMANLRLARKHIAQSLDLDPARPCQYSRPVCSRSVGFGIFGRVGSGIQEQTRCRGRWCRGGTRAGKVWSRAACKAVFWVQDAEGSCRGNGIAYFQQNSNLTRLLDPIIKAFELLQ